MTYLSELANYILTNAISRSPAYQKLGRLGTSIAMFLGNSDFGGKK